jgi:hypothetical protein
MKANGRFKVGGHDVRSGKPVAGRYVEVGRSVARRRANDSLGAVDDDGCVVQIV